MADIHAWAPIHPSSLIIRGELGLRVWLHLGTMINPWHYDMFLNEL